MTEFLEVDHLDRIFLITTLYALIHLATIPRPNLLVRKVGVWANVLFIIPGYGWKGQV